MCTCIAYKNSNFYFGRNLDLEYAFGQEVCICPSNYVFKFNNGEIIDKHYAMIGVASKNDGFPLYAEATNEKGLSIAGLNFPNNAHYFDIIDDKLNLAPYEFMVYILAKCQSIKEARPYLEKLNIANIPYMNFGLSPLHFILADRDECLTIEQTSDGLHIYDNPYGVLTNNPPFPYHLANLNNYANLSNKNVGGTFKDTLDLKFFAEGMGAIGLPGDYSSTSRFIKTCFVKSNTICEPNEESEVSAFFRILDSVSMPRGSVIAKSGLPDITFYTSCMNVDKGIYYYKTYDSQTISAINMFKEDLESDKLIFYPLETKMHINYQN